MYRVTSRTSITKRFRKEKCVLSIITPHSRIEKTEYAIVKSQVTAQNINRTVMFLMGFLTLLCTNKLETN